MYCRGFYRVREVTHSDLKSFPLCADSNSTWKNFSYVAPVEYVNCMKSMVMLHHYKNITTKLFPREKCKCVLSPFKECKVTLRRVTKAAIMKACCLISLTIKFDKCSKQL